LIGFFIGMEMGFPKDKILSGQFRQGEGGIFEIKKRIFP